jgi:hypothetical protein
MGLFSHYDHLEVDFDKEVDIDVYIDFDSDVDNYNDIYTWAYTDVDTDVHINGNFAQLTFDVTASGRDTDAQASVSVLAVEDTLSEVSGTMYAAVA